MKMSSLGLCLSIAHIQQYLSETVPATWLWNSDIELNHFSYSTLEATKEQNKNIRIKLFSEQVPS